jgi:hypothetical protein
MLSFSMKVAVSGMVFWVLAGCALQIFSSDRVRSFCVYAIFFGFALMFVGGLSEVWLNR